MKGVSGITGVAEPALPALLSPQPWQADHGAGVATRDLFNIPESGKNRPPPPTFLLLCAQWHLLFYSIVPLSCLPLVPAVPVEGMELQSCSYSHQSVSTRSQVQLGTVAMAMVTGRFPHPCTYSQVGREHPGDQKRWRNPPAVPAESMPHAAQLKQLRNSSCYQVRWRQWRLQQWW